MRIISIFLMQFIVLSALAQVKKMNAESSIQNVIVFSSGARVERSSAVSLSPGRTEISFAGLSNQLEQQTVQLKADANITLLSVQTTKDFLTARKMEQQEKELQQNATAFKDKLDMDTKLLDVYKNEEAMLIKNQAIGGQSGVKALELKESLDLQRQRLTEVYGKQLDIQKKILIDQQDFERTNFQLIEISKKKDSTSFIVTALVESKESRTVNFKLQYNVKDAGWFAAYDVRVNQIAEPLHIVMNANVYQRSGETWKNVSLILNTGSPNENATPSELQPWRLGFYDPSVSVRSQVSQGVVTGRVVDKSGQPVAFATIRVNSGNNATSADANGFFRLNNISVNGIATVSGIGFSAKKINLQPGYMTIELDQSVQNLREVVVVGYSSVEREETTGASTQFKDKKLELNETVAMTTVFQPTTTVFSIDEKYTLETDGKTTTIGIKAFDVDATYDYYTAPKIDPSVFLTARIANWQDYNLQSGEASLYFEGSYLGKTYIDLGTVADTLSLSLGKDNGIKVSRKLIKEFSSKKFIGSTQTETKDYEITVRNTKAVPAGITILDQYPISITKEIQVDDLSAPEGQANKDTGIITWQLTLQPGQEKKLSIRYSVKYPKYRKVVLD